MKKFYLLCTSVMLVAFSLFQLSAKATDRITINLEPGGHSTVAAESLQLAIESTSVALGDITKIEITAGELNADDWTYLSSVKGQLTSLTDFISGDAVTISGAMPKKVLPTSLVRLSMHTLTALPDEAISYYSSLAEVDLPQLTTLGSKAFQSCGKLERVSFGDQLTALSAHSFENCRSLTQLTIPGVTTIGDAALTGTGFVSFENDKITSLGEEAFQHCNALKHVKLNAVTTVGNYALAYCEALESLELMQATTLNEGAIYGCTTLPFIALPKLNEVGAYALGGDTKLTLMALGATPPATVHADAFYDASTPRTLILVNEQGEPLRGGEYATAVALYDPGTTNQWNGWDIGSENYYKISTIVDKGNGTVSAPIYAEAGTTVEIVPAPGAGEALLSATYTPAGGSAQPITANSFEMPNANVEVHVKFGVNSLKLHINGDNSAELTGTSLEVALQGQTLATLAQIEVFSGTFTEADWEYLQSKSKELTSLRHFTITEAMELVAPMPVPQMEAISGVPGLERSLLFPETIEEVSIAQVSEVKEKVFSRLPHLQHVMLPAATTVGEQAFVGCAELMEVSLPMLEKVGERAFAEDAKLNSIGSPTSIVTIGTRAFNACAMLPSIDLTHTTSIGSDAFAGCDAITEISAPELTVLSSNAFSSCASLVKVDMPKVTDVQTSALSSCPELATAIFPNLATIGNSAFFECPKLVNFTLGATPPTVADKSAFAQGTRTTTPLHLVASDGSPLEGQPLEDAIAIYKAADDGGTAGDNFWYNWAIEPIKYSITVSADVENGTIEIAPSASVKEGTEVTLTPKPSDPAKYRLKEGSLKAYKSDDKNVMVTISDGKFQMPAYNVTVTAMFEANEAPTPVNEASYSLSLYPNPATTTFQIRGLQGTERVRIYNVIGTPVMDLMVHENDPIDISTLHTGFYFVYVNGESYRLIVR